MGNLTGIPLGMHCGCSWEPHCGSMGDVLWIPLGIPYRMHCGSCWGCIGDSIGISIGDADGQSAVGSVTTGNVGWSAARRCE